MAHQTAIAAVERVDHRIDVLRAREQQHRRRLLGDLGADVVDEGVVQVRGVVGLAQPPCSASGHEAGGEPGRAEERARDGAGERALRGALADDVSWTQGASCEAPITSEYARSAPSMWSKIIRARSRLMAARYAARAEGRILPTGGSRYSPSRSRSAASITTWSSGLNGAM
jgi:hypothetical protein